MAMCICRFKKQRKQIPGSTSKYNSQNNGYRNVDKILYMCTAALCHSRKCGKKHDYINIIAGSASQDHLRNAFGSSVFLIHKLYHSRHNHCRRYSTHHSPRYGRFQPCDPQKIRCQQNISKNLKSGRNACHHNSRASDLFQVCKIQGKSCLQQNNDQRNLAKFRRDRKNGRIQHIQHIRSKQDTCDQHPDNTGKLQPLADCRQRKTNKKNKSQ